MADSADTGDAPSPVQVFVTTPGAGAGAPLAPIVTTTLAGGRKPAEAASPSSATATSSVAESFASRFRRSVNISNNGTVKGRGDREAPPPAAAAGGAGSLRIHHGAMDQGTITTGQPPEVMRHVREVLMGMGVEIFVESEYKYRCIRAKQRRNGKSTVGVSTGPGAPGGVAAFTMSSQVSTAPGSTSFDGDDSLNTSGILTAEPASQVDTVYGTSVEDAGDEVRFSVELTRLNLLNDTYSLDIRRLKGNLRSYKFLYDTLRKYAAVFCFCVPWMLTDGFSLLSFSRRADLQR
ncbi:hypothetical protein K438DRAFT_1615490 [Mycena galopus ATCC 62051]|nr:hypothetical protein K438DRAFT_1615490 [Mycena galopus ATCC 62051]